MSGYKRFVSYIYVYHNGKKERNAGFAKVEARGGQCKIQLRLQKIYPEETALDIYGFVRDGKGLRGVPLGQISGQRGSAEGMILTEEQGIGGSQWGLSELSGLWAKGTSGTDYITVWDDLPLETGGLIVVTPEQEAWEMEPTVEDIGQESETAQLAMEGEPEEAQSAMEGEPETERELVQAVAAAETEPEEAQSAMEGEPEAEREPVQAVAAAETEPEEAQSTMEGEPETEREPVQAVAAAETASPALRVQEAVCPLPASVCPNTRYCPPGLMYRWDCLSRNYFHRNPFRSPEIQDCIQICPRDVMALQQQYWNFSRNSFLLHGYLNYHYLLLIRRRDGICLLGIPGIYSLQEERMAAMFGFPQFLDAPGENQGKGFGFWCRPVE